ncbi:MAG: hypothetical protein EBV48_00495, partial [Betaproteobacteria bacterium]|nr:hypothetical protein [Betaproteobacteria bacterium]
MNLRWKSVLIAVQALLIVGLVWTLALYGRDEFQADGDGDDPRCGCGERVVTVAIGLKLVAAIQRQGPHQPDDEQRLNSDQYRFPAQIHRLRGVGVAGR